MTRTLRERHRAAVAMLAFVLPASVAVALIERPAPPPATALGEVLHDQGIDAVRAEHRTVVREARAGGPTLAVTDALGAASILLGPVELSGTRRFVLPEGARTVAGTVLYSLAQARVAGSVALPSAERIRSREGVAR
jgi:hypothetical protein